MCGASSKGVQRSAAHLHPQECGGTYQRSPRSPCPPPPLPSPQEAHPPPPLPPPVPLPAVPQPRSARPASRPCSPPASGITAAPRSTGGSYPSAGRRWASHSRGEHRRRRRSAAGLLRRSSGSSDSSARGWTAAAVVGVGVVTVVAGARARCGGRRCWRCCRGRSSCSWRGGREAAARVVRRVGRE